MPIGKNAIKRVENNGYSKVESHAPDMENSVVVEPAAEPEKKKRRKTASHGEGCVRVEIGDDMPIWLL